MKKTATALLLLFLTFSSLFSSNDESWKVFSDKSVATIKITVNQNDLNFMLANPSSDSTHICKIIYQNSFIDDTVNSVGIRLRGNTSRFACKKSFKISFDAFVEEGKFYSLEKLNLNGEHNDPSMLRSKLCWDLFKDMNLISSRASYCEVYINEVYYGLYLNVEHVDDEFLEKNFSDPSGNLWKCLHPANLLYLGDDPNLYKYEVNNTRSYDLKTNEETDDYSKLAELIYIINEIPNSEFYDSLMNIIDIVDLFKYYAFDVLTGSWDDLWFGWNNYYLYFDPTSNKFRFIPYDYDNSFGISYDENEWCTRNIYNFGNENQPLLLNERLMNNGKFKNLFTHFLDHYSENMLKVNIWESRVDSIKETISPFAENTIKCWDFTNDDFHNSYNDENYSYNNGIRIPRSIKKFANDRYASLRNQLEYVNSEPSIYKTKIQKTYNDSLIIKAAIFSPHDLTDVYLHIHYNEEIKTFKLVHKPKSGTNEITDLDNWQITISLAEINQNSLYSFDAHDEFGNMSSIKKNKIEIISDATREIILNEIVSTNSSILADDFNEYEDFIELYNPQDTAINLTGKYLTDKKDNLVKWQFGENIKIEPKSYLLVWCDEDGSQGDLHANFKLSSSGEFTAIVDTDGVTIIDSVTIPTIPENESFARDNNSGEWYITNSTTPGASNIITNIKSNELIKNKFSLSAYPNPFNPVTKINYEIPEESNVKISVYNNIGKEITTLFNSKQKPGNYNIEWNAKDYASSVYFIKVQSGKYFKTLKVILIK